MEKGKVKVKEKAESLQRVQVEMKVPRGLKIPCKRWRLRQL